MDGFKARVVAIEPGVRPVVKAQAHAQPVAGLITDLNAGAEFDGPAEIDAVLANNPDHCFVFHGEEASVADFFAAKLQQRLRCPQLPCILAGPRSSPGLIRLPLELLRFEESDNAADGAASRPQPHEILAMPPALRALVEHISRAEGGD